MTRQRVPNAELLSDTARANLLVNGGFENWQRGVGPFSQTNTFTGMVSADRWQFGPPSAGTITVAVDAGNQDAGSRVCAQVNLSGTTTPVSGGLIYQNFISSVSVDGYELRGRMLSFSLRAKTSVANGLRIAINDVQGGSRPMSAYHSGSGQYETLRVATVIPVSSNCTNGQVNILFDANGQYFVDNAMLVVGTVAADYVPLHSADDLARCLRYYEVIVGTGASVGMGQAYSTTNASVPLRYTVIKAVTPTITVSAPGDFQLESAVFAALAVTSFSGVNIATGGADLRPVVASGLVAGNATALFGSGAGTGRLSFEANP